MVVRTLRVHAILVGLAIAAALAIRAAAVALAVATVRLVHVLSIVRTRVVWVLPIVVAVWLLMGAGLWLAVLAAGLVLALRSRVRCVVAAVLGVSSGSCSAEARLLGAALRVLADVVSLASTIRAESAAGAVSLVLASTLLSVLLCVIVVVSVATGLLSVVVRGVVPWRSRAEAALRTRSLRCRSREAVETGRSGGGVLLREAVVRLLLEPSWLLRVCLLELLPELLACAGCLWR